MECNTNSIGAPNGNNRGLYTSATQTVYLENGKLYIAGVENPTVGDADVTAYITVQRIAL
jgi:hypothetical protein